MLTEKVLTGDIRAAAQLMRDIDDDAQGATAHLKHLYPHTGHAHIIGLTGAPGAGKSTLMDGMVHHLRRQGKTVGVLAIDPTSPYSGGAILGDRVRLQRHADDGSVFIKSIATRGHVGGLSRSAFGIATVMDAMGKDVILVETVGAGQDEVDIIHLAHTTIVVITADMGDGIQAVKSGILETADIFALNKADMEGAEIALNEIKMMLSMQQARKSNWAPPVIKTLALRNQGVDELLRRAQDHWSFLKTDGLKDYQKHKMHTEFMIYFRRHLMEQSLSALEHGRKWRETMDSIARYDIDPCSAAEALVHALLKK